LASQLDVCTGLRSGRDEGPMKERPSVIRNSASPMGGTWDHRTRHHCRGAAQPHREPIGDHATSKAPRSVRTLGSCIVIFPGGAGTAEEISICRYSARSCQSEPAFPVVFTGPADSAEYFQQIHRFIGATLGSAAQARYKVIIDDPAGGARDVQAWRRFATIAPGE